MKINSTKHSSGFTTSTAVALQYQLLRKLRGLRGATSVTAIRFVKTAVCLRNWPFIILRLDRDPIVDRGLKDEAKLAIPGAVASTEYASALKQLCLNKPLNNMKVYGRHDTHGRCTGLAVPIMIDRPIQRRRSY